MLVAGTHASLLAGRYSVGGSPTIQVSPETCASEEVEELGKASVEIDLFHMVIFNFGGFVFFPRGGSLILDRFWAHLTEHCKVPNEIF